MIVALDAIVRAVGPAGARARSPAADLYSGMLTTTLAEDEILTGVELPVAPPGSGWACVEVARRAGDYAMCGAVAQVATDDGVLRDVRLALFGVSDTPARIGNVERRADADPTPPPTRSTSDHRPSADELKLMGDPRVDEEYSRHLAVVSSRNAP